MKVKNLMTRDVATCRANESLAAAVGVMWERDCGAVPVISNGVVAGMLTDRDVSIACTSRNKRASEILASEVISGSVCSVRPGVPVVEALAVMRKYGIRRLPVTGKKGEIKGIISIADVILASSKDKKLQKEVFRVICRLAEPHETSKES
ncbi:MAG: CBS domain-containing protein [Pyrinomonadaceae bacterium]